ncbi:hypothetical protein L6452_35060 [Arctium lappa]|uniref:Uncharacterized protein n=1 Tax=Arctium lappa TaxID=4217 RepID=A0ACB8YJV9_ARCLA|nr:hypothetical protein L6452_35060 [Arctium lappa]
MERSETERRIGEEDNKRTNKRKDSPYGPECKNRPSISSHRVWKEEEDYPSLVYKKQLSSPIRGLNQITHTNENPFSLYSLGFGASFSYT